MIAVLGPTGFTGRRIMHSLRRTRPDEEIIAVLRATSSRADVCGPRVTVRIADASDLPALVQALRGADQVICAMSLGFGHGPGIVRAVVEAEVPRAVFFSTTSIHTRVPTRTRAVRAAAEDAIMGSGIAWTIVRPTMIYGRPGDRNVERLLRYLSRAAAAGHCVVPVVGDGSALQQPVHVDDLAGAVVRLLNTPTTIGRAYDLAGPHALPLRRMIGVAAHALGRRVHVVPVPERACRLAVGLWSRTRLWPHLREEQVLRLREDKAFDSAAAHLDFGYAPQPFWAGVAGEVALLGLARRGGVRTGAESYS